MYNMTKVQKKQTKTIFIEEKNKNDMKYYD